MQYTVHPVPLWVSHAPQAKSFMMFESSYGQDLILGVYVWLVEAGGKKVLVDAGAKTQMSSAKVKDLKRTFSHQQSMEEGLAKFGTKLSDIDTVVLTHLHWDHVALARQLKNAKFYVQKAELAFARNPHPYAAPSYDQSLFDGLNFVVLEGDAKVTDGIRVLLTPGHSPGGQSIAIDTKKGVAVITGFCCIQENFEPNEEVRQTKPFVLPGIHMMNAPLLYDSMIKVKQAADAVIASHEASYADRESVP